MFTGIIENQGILISKRIQGKQMRLAFRFKRREKDIRLGESIAVDGVCLTVAKKSGQIFEVDVIKETLAATTLGRLKVKNRVNLERSLKVGDRLGGHFVTGHIDGIGQVQRIVKQGKNRSLQIKSTPDIIKLLAVKGSVAIDGISLTIQSLTPKSFKIGLIPVTLRETNLGTKKIGDCVNLEVDLITRYLSSLSDIGQTTESPQITVKKLKAQGF